jgi:hypothetical protein
MNTSQPITEEIPVAELDPHHSYIAAYHLGISVPEIARQHGVTTAWVYAILKKKGIPKRARLYTPPKPKPPSKTALRKITDAALVEKIVAARQRGDTWEHVTSELGISHMTAWRKARKALAALGMLDGQIQITPEQIVEARRNGARWEDIPGMFGIAGATAMALSRSLRMKLGMVRHKALANK